MPRSLKSDYLSSINYHLLKLLLAAMAEKIPLNPEILRWARETAGLTLEEAALKLNLHEAKGLSGVDRLCALEAGEEEPTRTMVLKMAKQYHRPLLTFYMSAPPRKGNRGQDFRTLPDGSSNSDEALLDALLRDVQARQSMVRAIIEDEGENEPLPFIGSVKMSDGISVVLNSIKNTILFDLEDFRRQSSPDSAFALLRNKVEKAGIFVLLIGNLGSHHTAIDLEIFRGFALSDEIAPFVVLNDQDAHSAWSFTLIHELVHLWLGLTGVSGARAEKTVEKFCNDVAGEFLLPSHELMGLNIDDETEAEAVKEIIMDFAKTKNLSNSLVAYKLFRLSMINYDTWKYLSSFFRRLWVSNRNELRQKAHDREGGGPNYYVVRTHRVGKTLISFIGRMMASGVITTSKAAKVLGVKSSNVRTLVDAGSSV